MDKLCFPKILLQVIFVLFWVKVSCSSGWPWTHFVVRMPLNTWLSCFRLQLLGLQISATKRSLVDWFGWLFNLFYLTNNSALDRLFVCAWIYSDKICSMRFTILFVFSVQHYIYPHFSVVSMLSRMWLQGWTERLTPPLTPITTVLPSHPVNFTPLGALYTGAIHICPSGSGRFCLV